MDSARFFGIGHSGNLPNITTIDKLNLSVNWILPWESCNKFDWNVSQVSPSAVQLDVSLHAQVDCQELGGKVYPAYYRAVEQAPTWC